MDDDRLVKVVMLEALELGSKVRWVKGLNQSLERCGWRGLDVMALNGVTAKEVKQVLKDTMWRRARADWREEAMGKLKLEMTGRLSEGFSAGAVMRRLGSLTETLARQTCLSHAGIREPNLLMTGRLMESECNA